MTIKHVNHGEISPFAFLKLFLGYELNILDSDISTFQVGDHREDSR
jgi:hypothetical protein